MKKILLLSMTIVLLFQMTWAAPLAFVDLEKNLDIYREIELKKEKDKFDVASALAGQNSAQAGLDTYGSFDIKPKLMTKFELTLASNTLVDKATLGNKIKDISYSVERNATVLGAKKLYLATLSAKLDVDLQSETLQYKENLLDVATQKLKRGLITELEQKKIALEHDQAQIAFDEKEATYQSFYRKLSHMLHDEVLIQPEIPLDYPLRPLEYYLQYTDSRIELQSLKLNNQILAVDLPYYEMENFLKRDTLKEKYDRIKIDMHRNDVSYQQQRYIIKREIQDAYIDVQTAINQVETLKQQLEQLTKRYEQMQNTLKQGLISPLEVQAFHLNVTRLKNGYNLAATSLNLKRTQLTYALSVGPAYSGEERE